MAKIECDLDYVDLENEDGFDVESVMVTCSKCGASEESFGTGENSVNRCLLLLNRNCSENNFYFVEE